jgi:hypothetical protein
MRGIVRVYLVVMSLLGGDLRPGISSADEPAHPKRSVLVELYTSQG